MAEEEAKANGNTAFSAGNFTEAITHFTEAINISPNNHILYSNRSAAYASLSNFTQALSDAKKTVEIKPAWSKGYSRLGAAYIGLKNYSEAVSSYKMGLQIDPNNDALKSGLTDAESALKRKDELLKALESAESVDDTLRAFREMEACFEESELGLECFVVADRILRLSKDSEQVLRLGERALTILTDNYKRTKLISYLLFADVLRLLGCACYDLKKFDECLCYLNRADRNLSKVANNNSRRMWSALDIQIELCNVKKDLGMMDEAAVHSRKILDIKEKLMEKGCVELGEANMDVSAAYMTAYNIKEALSFCLKAVDIYTNKLGPDSVEAAKATMHLAVIYHQMGEHDKAFKLNRSAMTVLKKTNLHSSDLVEADIESANMLIDLGKYEEAVDVLKGVVSCEDMAGDSRVKSFTTMARALCYWGKFDDAEKYMNLIKRMIEETEMNPTMVAVAFTDLSSLYQKTNNIEKAVSLMKTGLALPGLPQNLLTRFCATLISLMFKEKKDVSCMEGEAEKLNASFGPKHCVLGYGYSNLGLSYLESGQMELAAKSLAKSKDILDVTLGPHHLTSLKISNGLSLTYAKLGRYVQALKIVEKVLEGMKGLEPSELSFMHQVVKHLNNMKEKVAESPEMNEDLCAKISDDGKGS